MSEHTNQTLASESKSSTLDSNSSTGSILSSLSTMSLSCTTEKAHHQSANEDDLIQTQDMSSTASELPLERPKGPCFYPSLELNNERGFRHRQEKTADSIELIATNAEYTRTFIHLHVRLLDHTKLLFSEDSGITKSRLKNGWVTKTLSCEERSEVEQVSKVLIQDWLTLNHSIVDLFYHVSLLMKSTQSNDNKVLVNEPLAIKLPGQLKLLDVDAMIAMAGMREATVAMKQAEQRIKERIETLVTSVLSDAELHEMRFSVIKGITALDYNMPFKPYSERYFLVYLIHELHYTFDKERIHAIEELSDWACQRYADMSSLMQA